MAAPTDANGVEYYLFAFILRHLKYTEAFHWHFYTVIKLYILHEEPPLLHSRNCNASRQIYNIFLAGNYCSNFI